MMGSQRRAFLKRRHFAPRCIGYEPQAFELMRVENKVSWFHGESDGVSGAPKILADLRDDGEVISRKTVAKMMRKLGLADICPKWWKTTTITDRADGGGIAPHRPMMIWDHLSLPTRSTR